MAGAVRVGGTAESYIKCAYSYKCRKYVIEREKVKEGQKNIAHLFTL